MARPPRRSKAAVLGSRPREPPSGDSLRPAWITLSLAGLLALQLWLSWGKLGLPFLDTRLHYDYDNADYSWKVRSGIRNGDLRSQWGVTDNVYIRWGERIGSPTYSMDHPFLVKTLFQQYAKIVGTEEWASRSFYLAVSFAIAAGLFVVLLQTTRSLLAAFAGAATFVSLPLCAVYQTVVKYEADGMLVGVWLFVALAAYLRTGRRTAQIAYATLAALAVLTHWTAILFVGLLGVGLLVRAWRGKDPRVRRALLVTAGAGLAGAVLLAALQSFLQGGWRAALEVLVQAYSRRSGAIPAGAWWDRQWLYAKLNFGSGVVWLVLIPSLVLASRRLWRRPVAEAGAARESAGLFATFFVSTLSVACVWVLAFRQGSFIHIYWQYWFAFPISALVAAALASLGDRRWTLAAGAALCGATIVVLLAASRAAHDRVFADQLGTREDVEFLRSLRDDRFPRFVFVPVGEAALNPWFQGPLFQYYTDRPVVIADSDTALHDGDKLLVLRYTQRGQVVDGIAGWSGKRLVGEKCGRRICAYDVVAP